MRKNEFLQRLEESLVMDKPERDEVLRYYAEYFEEAGEEQEEAVIAEIGSPEELGSRLSAEFHEEERTEEAEPADAPWEDMVKDIGSAVERFLKKALRTTGAAVDEVAGRLESEWKRSEGTRSEAGKEINKAVKDAGRLAREGMEEAKQAAKAGLAHTRKAFASLKEILEDGGPEPFEYANFDMEPFHRVKVRVKNCALSLRPSQNTCYGADIRLAGASPDTVAVRVEEDTLVISCEAGSLCKTGISGGSSITLYLPGGVYEKLDLSTTNGRIEAEGLRLEDAEVKLKTRNAKIKLTDCLLGDSLQTETANGPIELAEVTTSAAVLYTVNAPVKVIGGCIGALNVESSNGALAIHGCTVERKLTAETANAAICLSLLETEDHYGLTADTGNASVVVDGEKAGAHYESPGHIPVKLQSDNGRIEVTFSQPPCVYEGDYSEGDEE